MALPVRQQLQYWGIAAVLFLLAIWVLGSVLLPFIIAGAVAYVLDPMADKLQRMGMSRVLATVTITLFALLLFVILALLVVPTLVNQAAGLISAAPEMIERFTNWLTTKFPALLDENSRIRQSLNEIGSTIQDHGADLLNSILSSAMSIVNIIVLIVLVPVITFYLLLDWDKMTGRVDALLPRDHAPVIRRLGGEINQTLASFIRGQGTVCLILGTYYAIALMICQVQFGLVIGAFAGLITFIPYIGALLGGALAIGVALFQFWGEWGWIAAVAIVFVVGQFLEGNVLTPKLVGKSVGLHPVWLLFALAAFGTLFGFTGMLIAVPVAAALGVLTRFGIAQYQASLLFQGKEGLAAREAAALAAVEQPRPRPRRKKADVPAADL